MGFLRTGTCSRCGECCGYPRSTDQGQNNPWPADWPQSIQSWSPEAIQLHLPIMQFSTDMVNTPSGNFTIGGKRCYWIWVKDHGLCTDISPYGDPVTYDQRCPLLGAKAKDGTVPCLLVGTKWQFIHDQLCAPYPAGKFEFQSQVNEWFTNCPSCSYMYVRE